jgi:hypothetical protein
MAKEKDGGKNNYTPIKNQELLGGQPDTRTPKQHALDGPKDSVKKDDEKFVDAIRRTVVKEIQPYREKIERHRPPKKEQGKDQDKDKNNNEPEKDR